MFVNFTGFKNIKLHKIFKNQQTEPKVQKFLEKNIFEFIIFLSFRLKL